jgi:hypothetical protein
MHNATFLANQNELLRAANAKQTTKRAKSTKQVVYSTGYVAGETNEQVVVERNEMKVAEPVLAGPSETTQSLPYRAPPPRCSDCHTIGHMISQCKKQTK